MSPKLSIVNNRGFSLVELLAVMVIMGVLGSVATQKYDILSDSASLRALEFAISELNTRESLTWTNIKLSDVGWVDDETVFSLIDGGIGPDYHWSPEPQIDGGILHFKSEKIKLKRILSTSKSAGKWQIG